MYSFSFFIPFRLLFTLFTLGLLFFVPFSAFALSESDVALKLSPQTPVPLEEVTATLGSYALDLDRLPITWRVNGTTISSGTGKRTISVQAPAAGKTLSIVVTVTVGEASITKSVSVTTGNINLLWEAVDVSVPEFYQGKKLVTPEAVIRVVALPELKQGGVTLKANALVYTWKRNGKSIPNASGYGKQTVTFTNSYLKKSEVIEVTATSFDGKVNAKKAITIPVVNPFILFYEQSPLLGKRLEQALPKTVSMSGDEQTLSAEPYFFSKKGGVIETLSYEWRMNGEKINHQIDVPQSLVLRPEGNSGKAEVTLTVAHPEKILQKATNDISINF